MPLADRVAKLLIVSAVWGAVAVLSARAADLPVVMVTPAPVASPEVLPFFVRIGGSAVITDSSIRPKIAGVPVPDGNGYVTNEAAASIEAGYHFTPNIVASLAAGYPPTFAARGSGTLAPFGTLYKAQVGLPVLALTYHLDPIVGFRPYAGLGVGYAIVFANTAAAVLSPHLHGSPAFVLVGGVDYDLTARWSVFVDVKKAFLTQDVAGTVPLPEPVGPVLVSASARVRTDPLIVTTGVGYRF